MSMLPEGRSGDFTQAMMDLGATICRPKAPLCGECPLRRHCTALRSGDPEAFPAPKQKRARPHRHGIVHWIEKDGCVWLVRRPTKGLLGGMAALPGSEWAAELPARANAIGVVRHVFTHFSLDLHVVLASEPHGNGWWQRLDALNDAGLPTLYRKVADLALDAEQRRAA
jgi:A/G-specific adenine glycosylase